MNQIGTIPDTWLWETNKMANRYIRGSKETRMARLGIIEQEKIVEFIDETLDKELTRREKEAKQ